MKIGMKATGQESYMAKRCEVPNPTPPRGLQEVALFDLSTEDGRGME